MKTQKTSFHPFTAQHFVRLIACIAALSAAAHGAYLLEIDIDGADDGPITYNSHFSFGGDTTTASSSVTSTAYGTNGADSIFGGDGTALPDTYVYTYSPTLDPDNLAVSAGTNLGGGNFATGVVGGGLGAYRVYATWGYTENVSGGLTRYSISTPGDVLVVDIDQNFKGDEWYLIGEINFSNAISNITVTQQPTEANSFVSMRAYGLLFESARIPEPATLVLLSTGGLLYRLHRNAQKKNMRHR